MKIIAVIEAVPDDNSGAGRLQVDELSVDASTYEEGRDRLREQVPAGWRMISLRRAEY